MVKTVLQLVGIDNGDTNPSIVLSCDSQKYLFNCGEASHRFTLEYKIKLSKLSTIFTTSTTWNAVGGLPGMLLTLAKAGNKEICIYGPPNLTHVLAASRNFVFRMSSKVRAIELDKFSSNFKDENLEVMPVFLNPTRKADKVTKDARDGSSLSNADVVMTDIPDAAITDDDTLDAAKEEYNLSLKQEIVSQMFNSGQKLSIPMGNSEAEQEYRKSLDRIRSAAKRNFNDTSLPQTRPSRTALAYICQTSRSRGKFDPEAAERMGAKAGKDFSILHSGNALRLADGETIVLPSDVMGHHTSGSVFIIVDCPSVDYILSLTMSPKFLPHFAGETNNPVKVIVHIAGPGVIENADYLRWLLKFGDSTQHIIISRNNCSKAITFTASAISIARLNVLDNVIFCMPKYNNTTITPVGIPNVHVGQLMMKFNIDPRPCADLSDCRRLFDHEDPDGKCVKGLEKLVDYVSICNSTKTQIADWELNNNPIANDVAVYTLGTGAAISSRYRNVSCTVLEIPETGFILLDAGEGSFGQLYRKFGDEKLKSQFLQKLNLIFISHMHADHHIGVIKILIERRNLFASLNLELPTLWFIAPAQYFTWIQEYSGVQDIGLESFKFIDAANLLPQFLPKQEAVRSLVALMKTSLSLQSLSTVAVQHCNNSYALVVKHPKCKVVYSGDCRPSLELIETGEDCDLLIHEATFTSGEQFDAVKRRHTTVDEAIIVGKRMGAKFILLNHFSQRYPCAPRIVGESRVGVAFDLMGVSLGMIHRLGFFNDAIQSIYGVDRLPITYENDEIDLEETIDQANKDT